MQSILCRVNPQGGGIPKIGGLGQGDNAALGWIARGLFIEFWNNSQILMCWTHWFWGPIIISNTRVVAKKKGSCSTRSAYDQLLHIWKATLIAKGKCCYYAFWVLEDQEINDDPTNYPLGLVLSKTIPGVVRVAFFCLCRFCAKKLTLFLCYWCEPGWGCQWRDIWISLTHFLWSHHEECFV